MKPTGKSFGKSGQRDKTGFKDRPLSKKKQKQRAKSAQDMIAKMDAHTTADDIFNIVKSVESGIDTKARGDEAANAEPDSLQSSLKNIKEEARKDAATKKRQEAKQQQQKAELDEQLKLIEDFNL